MQVSHHHPAHNDDCPINVPSSTDLLTAAMHPHRLEHVRTDTIEFYVQYRRHDCRIVQHKDCRSIEACCYQCYQAECERLVKLYGKLQRAEQHVCSGEWTLDKWLNYVRDRGFSITVYYIDSDTVHERRRPSSTRHSASSSPTRAKRNRLASTLTPHHLARNSTVRQSV